jgi:hypothetical protein
VVGSIAWLDVFARIIFVSCISGRKDGQGRIHATVKEKSPTYQEKFK